MYSEQEKRAQRIAARYDDDDDSDEEYSHFNRRAVVEENPITLPSDGHCKRLVLMSVLAPIGHTYLAVAQSLNRLLSTSMVENEFVKLCVAEITAKVEGSECRYGKCAITIAIIISNSILYSQERAYQRTPFEIASKCWKNGRCWRYPATRVYDSYP